MGKVTAQKNLILLNREEAQVGPAKVAARCPIGFLTLKPSTNHSPSELVILRW
jgi:hypothetical protein